MSAASENRSVEDTSQSGLDFPRKIRELKSEEMQAVYARVKQIAKFDKHTPLLLGATGAGKDVIAELIHVNSPRNSEKLAAVNCAHFRGETLRTELFGYVGGMFTGGLKEGKAGLFEQTKGGTIFLDEVAEIPLEYQSDLLRALENKTIMRLGGDKEIEVDVRIIAATNADLRERVTLGTFREDLYHRLNVYPIEVPQLAGRALDILDLVNHFCASFEDTYDKAYTVKTQTAALNYLQRLDWPGNIRQLRNVVESIIIDNLTENHLNLTCEMVEKVFPPLEQSVLSKATRKAIWIPDSIWEQVLETAPIFGEEKVKDRSPNASDPRITLGAYCCVKRYGCDWKQVGDLYEDNKQGVSESTYNRLFTNNEAERIKIEALIDQYAEYGDMAKIPAGQFLMGSNDEMMGEEDDDAKPLHEVYINEFFMDPCVVTNEDFLEFVLANPGWQRSGWMSKQYCDQDYLRHWKEDNFPGVADSLPVIYVSWYAAMAYAKWVGKRLPTEAEWEKAARGGSKGLKYPWGDKIQAKSANYRTKGEPVGLKAVGSHDANNYGLFNMVGNVWEWCLDTYDAFFYDKRPTLKENPLALPPGAPQIGSLQWLLDNFTSIHKNSQAVTRGGGYADWYHILRVFQRNGNTRTLTNMSLGFRCVRDGGSI